jgi:hypothetical protein
MSSRYSCYGFAFRYTAKEMYSNDIIINYSLQLNCYERQLVNLNKESTLLKV